MSDSVAAPTTPSALANPEGANEENVSMPPPVESPPVESPASDSVVSESPASDPVLSESPASDSVVSESDAMSDSTSEGSAESTPEPELQEPEAPVVNRRKSSKRKRNTKADASKTACKAPAVPKRVHKTLRKMMQRLNKQKTMLNQTMRMVSKLSKNL